MISIRVPDSAKLAQLEDEVLLRLLSEYQFFHEHIGRFSDEELQFRSEPRRVISTLESEAFSRGIRQVDRDRLICSRVQAQQLGVGYKPSELVVDHHAYGDAGSDYPSVSALLARCVALGRDPPAVQALKTSLHQRIRKVKRMRHIRDRRLPWCMDPAGWANTLTEFPIVNAHVPART